MAGYSDTRDRVEDYFDRTATAVWARLTTDAPVSRIRETVRQGRDAMRALILTRLPDDLRGCRVLDAGCGTGLMTAELAARGADVVAVDIAPHLIEIARKRLPEGLAHRVRFESGDMLAEGLGSFDAVVAMDSLIYYALPDVVAAVSRLGARSAGPVVFTTPPRTPLLQAMFMAGKLFPRADRSPVMVPQSHRALALATGGRTRRIARVNRGFYISDCLEYRA